MNPKQTQPIKRSFGAERRFPWACRHCGKQEVFMGTIPYEAEVKHDGRVYAFTIPSLAIPICKACNQKIFTEQVDEQINHALRTHLHLLTPEEMSASLARLNMTPEEVARHLGIEETTLSYWLTGTQIQSRAMDNLLRVFFAFPEVRSVLSGESQDPQLGISDFAGHLPNSSS